VELLIIRHAIAEERDAKRWPDDRLRPLSPRGTQRGRKAAAGLAQLWARPEHVLTSPLLRARQTALLLERHARWPPAQLCADLDPETAPRALLARLTRSAGERVVVVGHEPHLSALLAQCLPGDTQRGISFRKMGAALVRFRTQVRPGGAQLIWFAPPKLLRAARKARQA
jgi:phosphohistidine phosphatase